jgi:hypothetical protein
MARKFLSRVRQSTATRRFAFAVGKYGTVPAAVVQRGGHSGAVTKLKAMPFDSKHAPTGVAGKKLSQPTSGLLSLQGKSTLVLQTKTRPPGGLARDLRGYFRQFKLSPPWSTVILRRLAEGDEGDFQGAQSQDEMDPFSDGVSDEEFSAVKEDNVKDEWETDVLAGGAPPPYTERPEQVSPSSINSPADVEEDFPRYEELSPSYVEQLTEQAEKITGLIYRKHDEIRADQRERLKALLEKLPAERVILAMARSPNLDSTLDSAEAIPDQPLTPGDSGNADVADALLAMGINVARERHALVDLETPDRTRIESMLRDKWKAKPDATPPQIVQEMIELLGQTFAAADNKRLRGLLGLSPSPNPLLLVRAKISPARIRLMEAHATLRTDIRRIRDAIATEFADDHRQAAALEQALKRLDDLGDTVANYNSVAGDLEAVEKAASAAEQDRLRELSGQDLAALRNFLETDQIILNLDGNELLSDINAALVMLKAVTEAEAAVA